MRRRLKHVLLGLLDIAMWLLMAWPIAREIAARLGVW